MKEYCLTPVKNILSRLLSEDKWDRIGEWTVAGHKKMYIYSSSHDARNKWLQTTVFQDFKPWWQAWRLKYKFKTQLGLDN